MFSITKHVPKADSYQKIRRIVDLTTPNRPVPDDVRTARRYNRCIPVVIADWSAKEVPSLDHLGLGFTTDLCDGGFGILTQHKPRTPENVIAFYLPDDFECPWYFHAVITTYRREPSNFHRLGYAIVGCLNDHTACKPMHQPVVNLLTPPSDA